MGEMITVVIFYIIHHLKIICWHKIQDGRKSFDHHDPHFALPTKRSNPPKNAVSWIFQNTFSEVSWVIFHKIKQKKLILNSGEHKIEDGRQNIDTADKGDK